MHRLNMAAVRSALVAAALSLGLATGVHAGSNITQEGDFGQLAKNGFAFAVDGSFYLDPAKTQFPNLPATGLGGPLNTYSWSMAWFQNQLWVGTNRNALSQDRVAAGPAEIWRYTPSAADPSGDWGLSGTWLRVFQSPNVSWLISTFSGGQIPSDMPRDDGYRDMAVCNAGGTGTLDRLYVTATGLPPNILYWNGSTFATTSTTGFPTTLLTLSNTSTADTGFRALVCFKGRLFASPAGTFTDVDISNHPVLLMNTDPAGGASWSTVLDVKNGGYGLPAGMADPDNIGIFQVEVMGDYLWLTTINRTTGFELWRGDGTDCQEPWVSSTCNIAWTKVIDNGAGRPADNVGPALDNAGATLGVYGHDLYIGAAESGFYQATYAELLRVQNADSATSPKWQLLAGWPRKNFADPSNRLPGLENLDCIDPGNMGSTPPAAWTSGPSFLRRSWLDASELDDASSAPGSDCLPASGSGPGLGLNPAYRDPLNPGPNSYFWRMTEHDGDFFIGSLDLTGSSYPGDAYGFNLYKTSDGESFTTVATTGLGNASAYGVRSLVSTPLGLFLGSANGTSTLPNGGTDVFLGTTAPAGQAAPKADAGANQFKFDTSQTGSLSFTLNAGNSTDSFGGAGLTASPYEWFQGAVADNCTSLSPASVFSTSATPTVTVGSNTPSPDVNSQTYTLRVTNQAGKVGCAEVTATASYNLPPNVDPWYSGANPMVLGVPATYPTSSRRQPNVNLIDDGGAGSVGYDVTAVCTDPESALVSCQFQSLASPGVTLSNIHDTTTDVSCGGMTACQISAHLSVPDWTTLPNTGYGGNSLRPGVQVLAVDNLGYQATQLWQSLSQPIIDNPGQNDKPVCRNADIAMIVGLDAQVTFDPTKVVPPICVDPDGDPMTYTPITAGPFPRYGSLSVGSTTLTYTPSDPSTPQVDYFTFRATDPGGLNTGNTPSRDPIVRVTLTQDTSKPSVAVGFPASGVSYSATSFADGCSTPGLGDVCGTAGDALSGVQSVQVAIRDAGGKFWNGSGFVDNAGTPLWQTASLGTADSWSFPFTPPADASYTLLAKSVDRVGNESGVVETPFGLQTDNDPPTVAVTFPSDGAAYWSWAFNVGCGTLTGDICGTASDAGTGVSTVEVSIQQASDGAWWNGSAFVAGGPIWLPASGTTSWSYPFSPTAGTYLVQARATDGADNLANSTVATFTRRRF